MRIRNPKILGTIVYLISIFLRSTLRVKSVAHPLFNFDSQHIYCFWHDQLLLPIITKQKQLKHPVAGFVSASKDGEVLSYWLKKIGFETARGSTSKRSVSGMVKLVNFIEKGFSVVITPDGPRGPRHQMSPGAAYLALKTGLKIVPVGVYNHRPKLFQRSWDKFQLPRPFAKGVLYFDAPITIDEVSDKNLELIRQRLELSTHHAKATYEGTLQEGGLNLLKDF